MCYTAEQYIDGVNDMEFSKKISFVREKLSMSQEELARALNVSFATVNRWENAKSKPIKVTLAAFESFCKKHKIDFGDENE